MKDFYAQVADRWAVHKQIEGESDRAAALVLTSFLDATIGDVLKSLLVDEKDVGNLFDEPGPLSSLGAKTAVGFAMGLMTREMRADADTIRKVRNKFALGWAVTSFESSPVADLCKSLHLPKAVLYVVDSGSPVLSPMTRPEAEGVVRGNDPRYFTLRAQFEQTCWMLAHYLRLVAQGTARRCQQRIQTGPLSRVRAGHPGAPRATLFRHKSPSHKVKGICGEKMLRGRWPVSGRESGLI